MSGRMLGPTTVGVAKCGLVAMATGAKCVPVCTFGTYNCAPVTVSLREVEECSVVSSRAGCKYASYPMVSSAGPKVVGSSRSVVGAVDGTVPVVITIAGFDGCGVMSIVANVR